jgi:hypothetical protein
MSHRDSVADGYGIELEGHAARLAHGLLDNPGYFVEMNVAGNYLAKAVCDGYKWLFDISFGYAAGVKKPAVGRSLKTALYFVASHLSSFLQSHTQTRAFSKRIL